MAVNPREYVMLRCLLPAPRKAACCLVLLLLLSAAACSTMWEVFPAWRKAVERGFEPSLSSFYINVISNKNLTRPDKLDSSILILIPNKDSYAKELMPNMEPMERMKMHGFYGFDIRIGLVLQKVQIADRTDMIQTIDVVRPEELTAPDYDFTLLWLEPDRWRLCSTVNNGCTEIFSTSYHLCIDVAGANALIADVSDFMRANGAKPAATQGNSSGEANPRVLRRGAL